MILALILAAAPPAAAAASLLKDLPETALAGEVIELRPADAHHFNVEAPQRCGGRRPLEVLPRRVRCRMPRPGKVPVLASVCDDARTFCRREEFEIEVRGASREAAASSPMLAEPKGGRKAPEGFLDNAPEEALARARKEGKLLLVDFYGIWCPPCNELEEHSYPSPEFRAAAKDFVLVALDADSSASFDWKARFKVGGYPTLVVADANLREIGRVVGSRSGPALASFMASALAQRSEPVEAAARLAERGGPEATQARRLRAARWRVDRGELDQAEALLAGIASPQARKALLTVRRARARSQEDPAMDLEALRALTASFPDDAGFPAWASALADRDAAGARPLEPALRRSVERWLAEPGLGAEGHAPGDLLYDLASFLDAVGSTEAARAAWSRSADAYAEQAGRSPLKVPRAANFGRAEALRRAGRAPEARRLYESLVEAYPGEFTFNYEYASSLKDDGEFAAAYPYAVKAADGGYGDNWLRAVRLKAELELKLAGPAEAARTIDDALTQVVPPASPAVRTFRYLSALRALRREISGPAAGPAPRPPARPASP